MTLVSRDKNPFRRERHIEAIRAQYRIIEQRRQWGNFEGDIPGILLSFRQDKKGIADANLSSPLADFADKATATGKRGELRHAGDISPPTSAQ